MRRDGMNASPDERADQDCLPAVVSKEKSGSAATRPDVDISTSVAASNAGSGARSLLLLYERAGRVRGAEGLVARNVRQDLIIVPRIFGLFRFFHLHEHEVMNHQTVLAKLSIA